MGHSIGVIVKEGKVAYVRACVEHLCGIEGYGMVCGICTTTLYLAT
jgi:hypothetical protein